MYAVVCHAEHDSTHMGFTGRRDIVPSVCSLGHIIVKEKFVSCRELCLHGEHVVRRQPVLKS